MWWLGQGWEVSSNSGKPDIGCQKASDTDTFQLFCSCGKTEGKKKSKKKGLIQLLGRVDCETQTWLKFLKWKPSLKKNSAEEQRALNYVARLGPSRPVTGLAQGPEYHRHSCHNCPEAPNGHLYHFPWVVTIVVSTRKTKLCLFFSKCWIVVQLPRKGGGNQRKGQAFH